MVLVSSLLRLEVVQLDEPKIRRLKMT